MNEPITFFAEISRIDEEKRIVEGFCYTQGTVKSDPFDLPYDVLRAASDEYMKWANLRVMHEPIAAGNVLSLDFQDDVQRVYITAEITDDHEWNKVKKKTYKGFSLKGRPEVHRGSFKAHKFHWLETSLVDRPADPGATITLFRRDDVPEDAAEAPAMTPEHAALYAELQRAYPGLTDYAAGDAGNDDPPPAALETEASRLAGSMHYDCGSKTCHGHKQHAAAMRCSAAAMGKAPEDNVAERGEIIRCCDCGMPVNEGFSLPFDGDLKATEYTPPTFEERVNSQERQAKASIAWSTLRDVLFGIAWGNAENKDAEARAAIGQFADYVVPLIGGSTTERGELFAPFTRLEKPSSDTPAAVEAAPTADEELDEMTTAEVTARFDALQALIEGVAARLDAAPTAESVQRLETTLTETQTKIGALETERTELKSEIKRIGDQPAGAPVARFPGALVRSVTQRFGEGNVGEDNLKKLARFEELQKIAPPADAKDREKLAEEVIGLQRELTAAALI